MHAIGPWPSRNGRFPCTLAASGTAWLWGKRVAIDIRSGRTLGPYDIEELLGGAVRRLTIRDVDLVNDTTYVDVRFQVNARSPQRTSS